jgi:hypothetical protein
MLKVFNSFGKKCLNVRVSYFASGTRLFTSDVNRPAKTARPGLGRFGPSHFGLAQARPQPGQAGPSQAGRA